VKIRATGVGKDSTIERMAALIRSAAENKSRAERLADRFAGIFLPIVGLVGLTGYFVTGNVNTMIAIFLVACADDMAVAIPLAITASMGQAARRGVVFKGGEWMDVAASITTVVLDKTGTLTYGERRVSEARLLPGTDPKMFWEHVAAAEKMIDQPLGRAMFNEALSHIGAASDPESFENRAGRGVVASVSGKKVVIGSETLLQEEHIALDPDAAEAAQALIHSRGVSAVYVALDGRCAGVVGIADVPRTEAAESIAALKRLGVRIVMLTGDTEEVAAYVASTLGIDEFRARMLPEDKLREVEKLMNEHKGIIAVVGDGINDAPALARADVGIAMGTTGMAVAVEAADVVILTDNLSRLPDIITLGRRTRSVVFGDMGLWLTTNAVGFTLVFTGFVGPALAAFYNFATDFLPIMNSARLFRR
ncbi:MAG TPA: heavy metal translocating P-type ATPase, partial [Candidatus Paceibacterota bacterium]